MATTEMINNGGPEGAPHEAPHQSMADGSSIGEGGMQASVEARSQYARGRSPVGGNDGRLGLDYATGEHFE